MYMWRVVCVLGVCVGLLLAQEAQPDEAGGGEVGEIVPPEGDTVDAGVEEGTDTSSEEAQVEPEPAEPAKPEEPEESQELEEPQEPAGPHWCYRGEYGPARWGELYAQCDVTNQSPINIVTSLAIFEDKLTKLLILDPYSRYRLFKVANTGHTFSVHLDHAVVVAGGGLPSTTFRVSEIQFHWGSTDNQGSEHTEDGARSPLEMQLLAYDSRRYDDFSEALSGVNAITVISVPFKIAEEDNPRLVPVVEGLKQVHQGGSEGSIPAFPVPWLLPQETGRYFRYLGSLTTPSCTGNVIWSVLHDTQAISSAQLSEFRELMEGGSPVYDNYRPVQPLGSRIVYRSFLFQNEMSKPLASEAQSESGAATPQAGALTMCMLIASQFL